MDQLSENLNNNNNLNTISNTKNEENDGNIKETNELVIIATSGIPKLAYSTSSKQRIGLF